MLKALLTGVFIASLFMFFPIHKSTSEIGFLGGIRAVLLSFFNSMQLFAMGCEFGIVSEAVESCPEDISAAFRLWASALYAFAPVLTFSFVLSLFRNLSEYIKYLCAYFKDAYVFSELNEKSLVLASDVKKNHPDCVIVFTDVFIGNQESSYELVERARALRAICFKKDVLVVDFNKHSKNKALYFFTVGEDETENVNQALKLVSSYKKRDNTHLYVFSTKLSSELLLACVDKGCIKVRRVNRVQSLVNRVLYEKGEILFKSAREGSDGLKRISAVIVGMGDHGTEMLKAISWYGQMDGYDLVINAFDKNPLAEEKFTAMAPELMSDKFNGTYIEGEARYKIKVHSGTDVETASFVNRILEIKDTSYVMVALGNDEINIKTAISLRMYYERMGIHPVIQAIVYSSEQRNALEGIKNYNGQEYDIEFIGDTEASFAESVIIDSELEQEALQRHLKWGSEEEFWNYEYNYRSSMASAIHRKARIVCKIPGADKKTELLTESERVTIEALEHRRWNAYMRAEGYIYSGSKEKTSRNDLAKMHYDLVDYSQLSVEERKKDSNIGTE